MKDLETNRGQRIARNTLMLYVRMLFLMFIGLYTSRVVLSTLGVTDYGIYGVVGGVVALFSVISGSLSAAITRFITFEMGKGTEARLKNVFSSAVTVQLILALLVVVIAEPLGIWFIENEINMPPDRHDAAHWVFQFSLLTFVINIISIPYNASIIAHERMSAFAVIGVLEGLAKLAVAFLIMYSPIDRLVYYAILMCVVAVGVRMAYSVYCRRHFPECRYTFMWEPDLLRQMFAFAGWNFIGAASGTLRDHGGNVLINIFCGPVANAARAVSVQLGGAVQSFVSNFMTAVNPQITKSYAAQEKEYALSLVFRSSRYSFYLLYMLSLPVLFNAGYILDLWLEDVPARSENFVCLALLLSLSECLSYPLVTLMLATGNIRNYQLIVGGLQLMNLPVSYLVLKAGAPPESIIVVAIVISQICLFARLLLLKGMTGLSASGFIKAVYLRVAAVFIVSGSVIYLISYMLKSDFVSFVISCIVCIAVNTAGIWLIGIDNEERKLLIDKIKTIRRAGR